MKTNIINTLIVAIILIAGWSLFTIFQDISTSKSDTLNGYNVIGVSKQYLPKAPESFTRNNNYPVYKPTKRIGSSANNNYRQQVPVSQNSAIGISTSSQQGVSGGLIAKDRAIVATRRQNGNSTENLSIQNLKSPNTSTPFSNNTRLNPDRNLADASVPLRSISGSSLSSASGGVIMKAFGGDDEGDDFEMGGGNENENLYNDVPVGEGLMAFLLFGLMYAFIKYLKRNLSLTR